MSRCLVLAPTSDPHAFVAPDGTRHVVPAGWACLPPGDAAWTRRVKLAGPSWAVVEKRGRKTFSKGLWAPRETIDAVRRALEAERATDAYAKRRSVDAARRDRTQSDYVATFEEEVERFLSFSAEWAPLGRALSKLVAAHATPIGSGTVARTKRIPVSARASAAVTAWMRHQTTAYDQMRIPRVKGGRREVRRELAELSRAVLDLHRHDVPHGIDACPLCAAVVAAHRRPPRNA
jgi:hypothetical protein